jgi:hypothetical protein
MAVWQPRFYVGWIAICRCQTLVMPSTVLGGMFVILWHVCNSFIKYEKSIFNKLQKNTLSIQTSLLPIQIYIGCVLHGGRFSANNMVEANHKVVPHVV